MAADGKYDCVVGYIPLYKAAIDDDWDSAAEIFKADPEAATAQITYYWETPLHIAAGSNRSHAFVERLVEWICEHSSVEKLRTCSYGGNNALHYAAKAGNKRAAELIVSKDPDLPLVQNPYRNTPLKLAAWYARRDLVWYLLDVTRDEVGEDGTSPYRASAGADLLTLSIDAEFYDVALYLVANYPELITERDRNNKTALQVLATKTRSFRSGWNLWFWQDFIYRWISINSKEAFGKSIKEIQGIKMHKRSECKVDAHVLNFFKSGCRKMNEVFWGAIHHLAAPFIKHMHELKLKHIQTRELITGMCSKIISKKKHEIAWNVLGEAMTTAAEFGIPEIVEACLRVYPGLIWYKKSDVGFLINIAIKHRQEKVYNLIYQMSAHKLYLGEDTILETVAQLAPPSRLNSVPGAALQMQRELQWLKEVEELARHTPKEDRITPRITFTKEHADLVKEGEQWMKNTATSFTVVAALIITAAFAAAFTVPGGNQSDGTPLYLKQRAFMVFAISDAIALFSSSTSVLMFLAVLTSRYAEEDFLRVLPKRLIVGLLSLFLSIASTMIAFGATLTIMLRHEIKWIALPVTLLASLPVTFFAFLQFSLLLEIVSSTYGCSIFRQQSKLLLH